MSTKKQLAIWIDHITAHVMEYQKNFMGKRVIFSGIAKEDEDELKTTTSLINNGMFARYCNQLIEIIEKYDHVLLFGPTNAKTELNKLLSKDNHCRNINIELRSAERMTDIQQYNFVKEYFSVSDH